MELLLWQVSNDSDLFPTHTYAMLKFALNVTFTEHFIASKRKRSVWIDLVCSIFNAPLSYRRFPKVCSATNTFDDRGYPVYKRSSSEDRFVVPYHAGISLFWDGEHPWSKFSLNYFMHSNIMYIPTLLLHSPLPLRSCQCWNMHCCQCHLLLVQILQ